MDRKELFFKSIKENQVLQNEFCKDPQKVLENLGLNLKKSASKLASETNGENQDAE